MLSRRCYCCQDSISIPQCNIAFVYRFLAFTLWSNEDLPQENNILYNNLDKVSMHAYQNI